MAGRLRGETKVKKNLVLAAANPHLPKVQEIFQPKFKQDPTIRVL
jgi:hypothetical protein